MTDLHPHWKATDDKQEPNVEIPVKEVVTAMPAEGAKVSRLPAAIIGMALVVTIGYLFTQGLFTLRGQLLDEVTVHITSELADPYSVTVEQGQTIAWFNENDLPQIITSDTFCSAEGDCLTTEPIFQGDTIRYEVPLDIPPGPYTYTSETSTEDVLGEIVVLEGGIAVDVFEDMPTEEEITTEELMELLSEEAAPNESEEVALEDIIEELSERRTAQPVPVPETEPAPPASEPEPVKNPIEYIQAEAAPGDINFEVAIPKANAPRAPKKPQAEIPRNPYTVGSDLSASVDLHGSAPLPWLPMDKGPPLQTQTQRPPAQPSTGAGAWFAFFLSVATMYLVARRFVRKAIC